MKKSNSTPLSVDTTGARPVSRTSTRPQSMASVRPPSSASSRPSSSLSLRPPSSASSLRPSSSASTYRPISPASFRPVSQASHRSASRFSYRPPKQASRLHLLCEALVTQVTGLSKEIDEEEFQWAVEAVIRDLDHGTKAAPSIDPNRMNNRIQSLHQKARIRSQDTWAAAFETSFKRLTSHMRTYKDLDQEITLDRLPEHLQLLIALAGPLGESSEASGRDYFHRLRNPDPRKNGLTWKEILDEEPFEGQHWEGVYGLPPGSTVEGWETMSADSTPPLSPLSVDGNRIRRSPSRGSSDPGVLEVDDSITLPSPTDQVSPAPLLYDHRQDVETLQSKQYWRKEWHLAQSKEFEFGLDPSLMRSLGERKNAPHNETYISEHDAVREVLMALQGLKNILLRWSCRGSSDFFFEPIPHGPRVPHLTNTSLGSILSNYSHLATTLEHLRKFVDRIYDSVIKPATESASSRIIPGHSRRITRSTEAFAEAIETQLLAFNTWCASQEQTIGMAILGTGSPVVVSFMSLDKSLRDGFSLSFDNILEVTRTVMRDTSNPKDRDAEAWMLAELPAYSLPSTISSHLLDTLLRKAQDNLAIGDPVTYEVLMSIFIAAARPMWSAIGRWLRDGMAIHDGRSQNTAGHTKLDDEFFIEDNELLLLDPDYWSEGFALRTPDFEENDLSPLPSFLQLIAPHILAAGKAVGLMRVLGALASDVDRGIHQERDWPEFSSLINPGIRMYSVDDVSRTVFDSIIDLCHDPQKRLMVAFFEDCGFWQHLAAIQDVYLSRRGDVMSIISDNLFSKIDSGQSWNDYHFLNSTLRDAIETGADEQINSSLFRLSYKGSRRVTNTRTLESLGYLSLEYSAPFPLTYILGPGTMQTYSGIFAFLLQIRRARHALARVLVRPGSLRSGQPRNEMKLFYAMRSRLSWFVCVLQDFIAKHAFQVEVAKLRQSLEKTKSLDEAILIHSAHLSKLSTLCFMDSKDASLRQTILSVLEMCLQFGDCFVAFTGDTTYTTARQRVATHRYRSRKAERLRKDTVDFTLPERESSDSDSDAEYEAIEERLREASMSMSASLSLSDEDFFGQVDRMSRDVDGLVRFFRRGVEGLASATLDVASTFGILAFTLEDWDR